MITRFLKLIALFITITTTLNSCVDSDNYNDPKVAIETFEFTPTTTVDALIATYTSSTPTLYTADDIIEAYVTSSDETGNFFNTISFQSTLGANPNIKGFSMSVELESFAKGFTPGRKVYIKLKDLYVAKIDGSLRIGATFEGTIGRISRYDWNKHLFASSTIVSESELVRFLTLAQASTDSNQNTLIEITNVQFTDTSLTRTLYDIDTGGGATNHNVVDVNGGTNRYLRTSSFATLAAVKVPSGRGSIRGIMSKFGSDFQFVIRYSTDLRLNNPRTYNFRSNFTENFNGFSAASGNFNSEVSYLSFKDYLNFSTVGTKNWFIRDNSVLEMSSFSGNVESNKCYFMVPVDMSVANTFTFQYKIQFISTAGRAFKIYRTTNFEPGMKIDDATLVDITTSFNIPAENTTNFVSAGTYTIPTSVTGNGYFVFEYVGTNITTGPPVTTTIQLDNIVVN